MTTKELTAIVVANTLAIAENTKTIAQLAQNSLILHDSIKSLEVTALAHDDAIESLSHDVAALTREWQAYIKTLPKT